MARIKKKIYKPGKLKSNVELTNQEIKLIHRLLTERKDEMDYDLKRMKRSFMIPHGIRITSTDQTVKKLIKLLKKMEDTSKELC